MPWKNPRNQKRLEYERAYAEEHRERLREYRREWRRKNAERLNEKRRQKNATGNFFREEALKNNYGLTANDYDMMYSAQNGKCLICMQDFPDRTLKGLVVDHSHSNDAVRGLLCQKCNIVLGASGDSLEVLERAIKYLEFFEIFPNVGIRQTKLDRDYHRKRGDNSSDNLRVVSKKANRANTKKD